MVDDKKDVPSKEGQTSEQPSGGVDPGSGKKGNEAPSLSDALRGKSVEEISQMYQNLQKKLGEQSSEVKDAREAKKNMEILLSAIYADPKRYETASGWIRDHLGASTQGETKTGEGGEEAGTKAKPEVKPKADDTRRALQDQMLTNFYKSKGIDRLTGEERKKEQLKVGTAFAELVDPGGTKPVAQLFNEVPLDRLPKYLESAYVFANREKIESESRQKGLLAAEERSQASIGTLSSTGGDEKGISLSPKERAAAEKMKVSPEDYAKKKAEIEKASRL